MAPGTRARWLIPVALCAAVAGVAADRGATVRAEVTVAEPTASEEGDTGWVCQVDMAEVSGIDDVDARPVGRTGVAQIAR